MFSVDAAKPAASSTTSLDARSAPKIRIKSFFSPSPPRVYLLLSPGPAVVFRTGSLLQLCTRKRTLLLHLRRQSRKCVTSILIPFCFPAPFPSTSSSPNCATYFSRSRRTPPGAPHAPSRGLHRFVFSFRELPSLFAPWGQEPPCLVTQFFCCALFSLALRSSHSALLAQLQSLRRCRCCTPFVRRNGGER